MHQTDCKWNERQLLTDGRTRQILAIVATTACAAVLIGGGALTRETPQHDLSSAGFFGKAAPSRALLVSRGGKRAGIYRLELGGRIGTYLVNAGSPAVSVTGRVAFTRREFGGRARVCIARLEQARLRDERCSVDGEGPSWSPDGKKLAYAWHDVVSILDLSTMETSDVIDDAQEPAWSPDGQSLAVTSPGRGVFVVDLDRPGVWRRATRGALDRNPAWNPRTGHLTVVRRDGRRLSTFLVSIDLKSGAERRLTSGKWNDRGPAWSHDGRYLAFSRSPAPVTLEGLEREEVFVLNRATAKVRQLTKNDVPDGGPSWIP